KAMAIVLNFSGKTPSQRMCLEPMTGPAISSMAIKRTCQFEQNREMLCNIASTLFPVMAAAQRSSGIYPSSPSPSDTIKKFYKCINEKNLKQLGMGQNVKFCIQHVCEGDELIGAANWHMEWKDKQIPYTRGCSFFEFSQKGEKIILKKAQIVIESPIKPGTVVLHDITSRYVSYRVPKESSYRFSMVMEDIHNTFRTTCRQLLKALEPCSSTAQLCILHCALHCKVFLQVERIRQCQS
ncbi:Nuclear transport factor 2 family protein, partial [Prunus dulcis]